MNPSLVTRHQEVLKTMDRACAASGRARCDVELIAVSKTVEAGAIRELHEAGQAHFAESRLQEAQGKIASLPAGIFWHFIGTIQSNKARRILAMFPVIHSVGSLRLASYMDEIARGMEIRPKILLEVNLAGEVAKAGFSVKALSDDFSSLLDLRHLDITGLMCIPPYSDEAEDSRPHFRALRELRDALQARHAHPLPWLSMGMSHDFPVAIEEGSTHVRVGTSIFGSRSTPTNP